MKPLKLPELIKCERIHLKFLTLADAPALFELIKSNRAFIGKHLDWVEYIKTPQDEINYVQSKVRQRQALKSFDWCIFKNRTNELLGYIGTDPVDENLMKNGDYIDWQNGVVSFAYFLKQIATGQGYMTEALNAVKDAAIKLGFSRVEINSDAANIKSQQVAQRCGFSPDPKAPGKMYL